MIAKKEWKRIYAPSGVDEQDQKNKRSFIQGLAIENISYVVI